MDTQNRIFSLLDEIRKGGCVVVRDDQYEFAEILDAARNAVLKGARFNLIDSGRFGSSELEWLAEAGAHCFTSDEARPSLGELGLILKACLRGNTSAALVQRGPLEDDERSDGLSFSALKELARRGFIIHISNREKTRDFDKLIELAEEARLGAGVLVYYHHGSPVPELAELAMRKARIHLSDRMLRKEDLDLIRLILKGSAGSASGIILHVEKGMAEFFLRMLQNEGAVLIFKTPPSEPDSLMGAIERKARRKTLDPRAYYLYTVFLL